METKYTRGQNPRSKANLRPVKPGEVRNPTGRPKNELSITSITRDQLGEPCPKDPTKTWAQYLSDRWLELACENVQAFKELMERLEGKVVFPIAAETPAVVTWVIGKGYVDRDVKELEGRSELGPVEIDLS